MENRLDGGSLDMEQVERERLKSVFPQCFVEGKLDIDKLLNLCGEYIDNDFEKYKFEWHGKGEALKLAQRRSMGALRPCVEESVDWDTTENLYIEGDNLEVLKLLQAAYYRRVKMIYIDPPYNTGNDFVYEDDFADPINRYKEVTSQTTKSNPETMGRFHTNWLNMIYPRLRLAANLLTDDGVIFISIDDNEIHNLRKVCDEVFGEENFVAQFIWKKKQGGGNDSNLVVGEHEYILCFCKSLMSTRLGLDKNYKLDDNLYPFKDEQGEYGLVTLDKSSIRFSESLVFEIEDKEGNKYYPRVVKGKQSCWRWGKKKVEAEFDKLVFKDGKVYTKYYRPDGVTPKSLLIDAIYGRTESGNDDIKSLFENNPFSYPKPLLLIKHFISIGAIEDNDIILDFFSGSGTTAHAVMQLNAEDRGNRKFICVQLPEVTDESSEAYKAGYKNICEIGKERIRRAGAKIASSSCHCGLDPQSTAATTLFDEIAGQARNDNEHPTSNGTNKESKKLDTGFKVFKLDTSNLKTWDASPINSNDSAQIDLFMERLNGMIETIKPDRTDTDMVYEVMLKMGIPLTYSVTPVEIGGKTAYSVGADCLLLVCLQEGLSTEIIETMASDYLPSKLVLSEKCFTDDTAMANAHYILKEREIELKLV